VLGFSYPDFDATKGKSKEFRRRYINDLVRERYGFVTEQTDNPALNLLSHFQTAPSDHDSHVALYDWVIHATFSYYELDDSFSIIFFYDEGKGVTRHNIIGTVDAFRGTTAKTCANCAANQEHIAEGFIHLNYYIGRDLGKNLTQEDKAQAVAIYEPDSVAKYLKEKKISCKVSTVSDSLGRCISSKLTKSSIGKRKA
jgi:tyrosinase